MIEKPEQRPVPITAFGEWPGFQYESKRFLFLNLGLDVKMDGVTYHMDSVFSQKSELGEVIDAIEMERSQRKST